MSCGVERDTGARLRNDLVWEAHYLGGAGKWGAWQLGRPEGGKLKGQSWEPTSPPPRTRCGILPARSRVTSQARAAERAGHHQRRESTRAWVDGGAGCEGGVLAFDCSQLCSASLLLLVPNLEKSRRVRESLRRG